MAKKQKQIDIRLTIDTGQLDKELDDVNKDSKKKGKKAGNSFASSFGNVASVAIGNIFANIVSGLAQQFSNVFQTAIPGSIGAFVNYEKGLRGVKKTLSLTEQEASLVGNQLRNMTTTTSIDQLQEIARIGGQFNVSKDQIVGFTKTIDQANVSLGDDFGGSAEVVATQLAEMTSVFKDDFDDEEIGESLSRVGSAINELGASGTATAGNITDFATRVGSRVGQLDSQEALAFAAALEEIGIKSEVGARGLSIVFNTASQNVGDFAKQMGLSNKEVTDLINQQPVKFIEELAGSFEGMTDVEVANALKDLGIGASGAQAVIKALSTDTESLTDKLKLSRKAFGENTSLQKEFETVTGDNAAKAAIFRKGLEDIQITIGNLLIDLFNAVGGFEAMDSIMEEIDTFSKGFLEGFQEKTDDIKEAAGVLGEAFFNLGVELGIVDEKSGEVEGSFAIGQESGMIFADVIVFLIEQLTNLVNWISENEEDIIKFAENVAKIAGAMADVIETTSAFNEDVRNAPENFGKYIGELKDGDLYEKKATKKGTKEPTFGDRLKDFVFGGTRFANAEGTSMFPGGVGLVGERGPEIIDMPRGTEVMSNNKSREMMRQMGGSNKNIDITNNIYNEGMDEVALSNLLGFQIKTA